MGQALRPLAILDSQAGDFESADRRLAELIAIYEAAADRGQLLGAHSLVAELAASRGDIARATSHLAAGARLAHDMQAASEGAVEWLSLLVASAAYVAYMDDRADDAAVLFGARVGLSRLTFPKRFRPIVQALEGQDLREEITAGTNLSADEALERVVQSTSPTHDRIGRQGDVGGGPAVASDPEL